MNTQMLVRRNLTHYWRTNLAVLGGVAAAVAVLAGALLVGESVRASLRDLAISRLGNTGSVVTSATFFREKLADAFGQACPMIVLEGIVVEGRHSKVQVYGVDERFWKFHGHAPVSEAASDMVIRVQAQGAIPLESLHGRKDEAGRTMRLRPLLLSRSDPLSEFSLRPQQGEVRTVFVPLRRLQRDLKQEGRVNTILVQSEEGVAQRLRDVFTLDDLGVRVRPLEKQGMLSVEKSSALIDEPLAEAVRSVSKESSSYFTYLVNSIRANGREIPYSLVTAGPWQAGLQLNAWAAHDLGARVGDKVTLEFYVWKESGELDTQKAEFPLTGIVPMTGPMADRDLAPDYPGISGTLHLTDWDPPFPLDLKRVRPRDEEYWDDYRTTPKAFLPLQVGQYLWKSRFGSLTSMRVPASDDFAARLRAKIDPARMGLAAYPVRAQNLASSRGATDFGEYFVYFSFFLVVSGVLLAVLFFKLGVEQRMKEIGVLQTLGFDAAAIRKIFMKEGYVLSIIGSYAGMICAIAYGWLIMVGLRTWWIGATGTSLLRLHVSPVPLGIGFVAGIAASQISIAWTLRSLRGFTPRGLVLGTRAGKAGRKAFVLASFVGIGGVLQLIAAVEKWVSPTEGFFTAASLLLVAFLCAAWIWLTGSRWQLRSAAHLGFRSATHRPGRSILCIALIASATFIIVSIDAFRRPPEASNSGSGGYPLMAESLLPIVYDANTESGRENLSLTALPKMDFVSFRLRPGDDASCLNLYEPRNPRILGAPSAYIHGGRDPWPLLETDLPNGVIPAIADANSMTYVLHRALGEELIVNGVRLKMVGALADSIFQGEIIIAEKNFLRAFPEQQGFRFFLLDAPPEAARRLEEALKDYGFETTTTAERLASFHKVENTYLSTFQALGGLGLVLGTVGLAAVLLRNVLERRRELALLRAVGYRGRDLAVMVLAENLVLLAGGLISGTITAVLAIAPEIVSRGGHVPLMSFGLLLPAVLITGLAASLFAVFAVVRAPLLPALRSE